MDQPSVDGLNTWLVSRACADQGLKVALSGLGGDDFLWWLLNVYHRSGLVSPPHSRGIGAGRRRGVTATASRWLTSHEPKAAGMLDMPSSLANAWLLRRCVHAPWELASVLGRGRAAAALNELDLNTVLSHAMSPEPNTDVGTIAALKEVSICATNSCETRIGLAWRTHWRFAYRWLTQCFFPSSHSPSLIRGNHRKESRCLVTHRTIASEGGPGAVQRRASLCPWRAILNNPDYNQWNRIPAYLHSRCGWAKRWSYVVADQFGMI